MRATGTNLLDTGSGRLRRENWQSQQQQTANDDERLLHVLIILYSLQIG
jgi:hypothetical protein